MGSMKDEMNNLSREMKNIRLTLTEAKKGNHSTRQRRPSMTVVGLT